MDIRDRIKELRRVPASDLIPHPENWRTHPEEQRTALMAVLQEVGYAQALVCRETDDGKIQIIDGHLRADATPDAVVPVLIVDVTEEEARKLLASMDPITQLAEADSENLSALLESLEADTEEFKQLVQFVATIHDIQEDLQIEEEEQPIPELPPKPRIKPGDVWKLGDHRPMCGDALNPKHVKKLLQDVIPGLMVTDPPYGVGYEPAWRDEHNYSPNRRTGTMEADDTHDWTEAYRLFPGDIAYVWHAGIYSGAVHLHLAECEFEIRAQIIWNKQNSVFGRGAYHWKHEPCFYAVRKGKKANWAGGRKQDTVWDIPNANPYGGNDDDTTTSHGAQKPVLCMATPIQNHDSPHVYDPFMGSGTTLIAGEQLNRVCYGMDIDPRYVDVAVQRWENLTGLKAKKV